MNNSNKRTLDGGNKNPPSNKKVKTNELEESSQAVEELAANKDIISDVGYNNSNKRALDGGSVNLQIKKKKPNRLVEDLRDYQLNAIKEQKAFKKCLINMWCGTGKTRTFTIDIFMHKYKLSVIVFPSLGLIRQYCNDYILSNQPTFKNEFKDYKFMAFCSEKKISDSNIDFTTDEQQIIEFIKSSNKKKIIIVTYDSLDKFITECIKKKIIINNLVFDEAHHILSEGIKDLVFNNNQLDAIVNKTRFYTATPINKNGVIMYDRENPENSDCGPLAFEYLYCHALENNFCKAFETQISLHTQKPEYTTKYQPIFESIIRTCLNGKYDYWNILTYHSYVNDRNNNNDTISFVKDFSSDGNQKLFKELFTKIQDEEFGHTKSLFNVNNVQLRGIHDKSKDKETLLKKFDKKDPGRIFILSSCGMINEGIDTKWANMCVPVNPSQSITKVSQRIGRLVRIPEKGMPPAIILIPCVVNITKYNSLDTSELRDKMIREELSKCGNFNTALSVISAFKFQYDPELFEMCLKYPNSYAPKEIKDNLEKHDLIVEDSQGNLLENLKYVCEKEDIELDTESFEGKNEDVILKEIADQCEKTIEIHTQKYDESIKYVNKESVDEEPLRLFYNEDDKTYYPVTKKDKKKSIKKGTVKTPIKRKPLFKVHTHQDLKVLWKIKENGIDLNKAFCQGILDVDIKWNVKIWNEKFNIFKAFIDDKNELPTRKSNKILSEWGITQKKNYKKRKDIMKNLKIYNTWSEFINDEKYNKYFLTNDKKWFFRLNEYKSFIDENQELPTQKSNKRLWEWRQTMYRLYKNRTYIMQNNKIYDAWGAFMNDEKYRKFFLTKDDKWFITFDEYKSFIDENQALPTQKNNKRLCRWGEVQNYNYKKKKKKTIMQNNQKVYDTWKAFINDEKYKKYFLTKDDKWFITFDEYKLFIDKNQKLPSEKKTAGKEEKRLNKWGGHQISNYKNKNFVMKNKKVYNNWTEFINDEKYKKYFIDRDNTQIKLCIECNEVKSLESFYPTHAKCKVCYKKIKKHKKKSKNSIKVTNYNSSQNEDNNNSNLSKNPKPKEDNLDRKITVEEANALENNNIDLSMNTQSNIIKKKKEERKIEDLTKEELIELVKKGESKNYESGIYCSDKRENDENKLQINSVYAKETSENKSGKIMILDGDKLITRKHLLDVGINEDDIFIAQFNEDDYNEQIKIHKNTYLMTLTDLLKEKKNLKFSSCWFDYLGQFNGSEKCRPKEDIDYYFKNDMALDNSIFALTFTTQHTSFNDSYESLNYVRDICKKYNYQADRIESKYYGSQMHFIMWRIFKN